MLAMILLTALLSVSPASCPESLEVTYLANEGFLVRSTQHCVLVDALFGRGVSGYPTVPPAIQKKILAGEKPYHDIDLVLATHVHPDHFDAEVVATFLRKHEKARFISTPQAVAKLRAVLESDTAALARVRSVLPKEGKRTTLDFDGLRVDAMQLTHGRTRKPPIQNLGFVVHIGGQRFLHIGDSEATGPDVRRYEFSKDRLDFAFLPCWYLAYDTWAPVVRKSIQARRIVMMHLPRPNAPKGYWGKHGSREKYVAAIRARFPDVLVFGPSGQRRRFAPRPAVETPEKRGKKTEERAGANRK